MIVLQFDHMYYKFTISTGFASRKRGGISGNLKLARSISVTHKNLLAIYMLQIAITNSL